VFFPLIFFRPLSYFWYLNKKALKIIIVDDSNVFKESIKYYLEKMLSHEVINMAGNGVEFLKIEDSYEADVILMDIEMPLLNGFETAKRALYENPALKLIAVTNYSDRVYLVDLISAGFKACIFKSNIYQELEKVFSKLHSKKLCFPKNIMLMNNQ
jgi:DNA-binding NarL/FixJ family response regulator